MFVEVRHDDPVGVVGGGGEVVFPPMRDGGEEERLALPHLVENVTRLQAGDDIAGGFVVDVAARVHDDEDVLARDTAASDVVIEEMIEEIGRARGCGGRAREEEDARVGGVEEGLAVRWGLERAGAPRNRPRFMGSPRRPRAGASRSASEDAARSPPFADADRAGGGLGRAQQTPRRAVSISPSRSTAGRSGAV